MDPWHPLHFKRLVLLAAIICFVLAGPVTAQDNPQSDAKLAALKVKVTASETGQPLDSAKVQFVGRIGPNRINQTENVDDSGSANLEYAAGDEVQHLWFTAQAPGYAPAHYIWRNDNKTIELPSEQLVSLETASVISGRVVDTSGRPIESATVDLSMPITWPKLDSYYFTLGEVQTDADGNWRFENAPKNPQQVSISISHRKYLKGRAAGSANSIVTVLEQGISIAGSVLTIDGQPIEAAQVRFGDDRFGTDEPTAVTDAAGRFELFNCKSKKSIVTVEAQGYAPQFLPVSVTTDQPQQNQQLEFRLEPGKVLKLRVVDDRGNPLEGVMVVTDTWRGYRTLEYNRRTGSDGTLQWDSAPADTVLFDLLKQGYMAARNTPLTASAEVQIVTLHPELVISGRVLDAQTKKNVKSFRIIRGQNQANSETTYWRRNDVASFTDGRFTYRIDEPILGWLLEISADGYRPVQSRVFKSDEGQATFNVLLQPADGPTGRVVDVQGQPVENAVVVLASENKNVHMKQGWVDLNNSSADRTTSAADGRFSFVPQDDENFLVMVFHDLGYAEVTHTQLETNADIKLQPWGRIEGQVLVGDKPDAGREVSFQPKRPVDGRSYRAIWSYGYETNADDQGRFHFDRVLPGPGTISRVIVVADGRYTMHAPSGQIPIEVQSNETTQATIGGSGRQVRGRLVLDHQPSPNGDNGSSDWRFDPTLTLELFDKQKKTLDPSFARYVGQVEKSGDFTIPDVPPGDYQIRMEVHAVGSDGNSSGTIGRTMLVVKIDESDVTPAASQDLGELTIELFDTLDPGEWAPSFVAETFDDRMLRLSDLQGKLVVINFWNTYSAASMAENSTWAATWIQELADDPRLAVVSISAEERKEAAAEALGQVNWPWLQIYAGPLYTKIPSDYAVRSLPANFIIAPNGRVLKKNVAAADMANVVSELLRDEKLFAEQDEFPPARFTVQRFESEGAVSVGELASSEDAGPNDHATPEVILFCDSDPSFDREIPHTDELIAYGPLGEELWRKAQFNISAGVGHQLVATDSSRNRIYVCENAADRLWALDASGNPVWRIDDIDTDCLVVDRSTGNLWCSGGGNLQYGETVVFSTTGEELTSWPFRAIAMDYDSVTDGFWLAGYQLIKLSREGDVQIRESVDGWCYDAISVCPLDGSVWIGERNHPDRSASRNRLWLRAADGSVMHKIELDKNDPRTVASLAASGNVLYSVYPAALWLAKRSGELSQLQGLDGVRSVTASRDGEHIWATTQTQLLRIEPAGDIIANVPFAQEKVDAIAIVFE